MVDPATRLRSLTSSERVPLDRAVAVIASLAPDPPTEGEVVTTLDQLASGLEPTDQPVLADDVITHTFGRLGFTGNAANYYDPANSFIHRVLDRRQGIPITLAVVAAEIGHRHGIELPVVGLPGHVVLGDGPDPQRWFDPFAGGAPLDEEGCRRIFARYHPSHPFQRSMLAPLGPIQVLTRVLTNLKLIYRQQGDLSRLAAVLDLTVALPDRGLSEHLELAAILAALGRDEQAAQQRDRLAALDPARAAQHRQMARRHRARRN